MALWGDNDSIGSTGTVSLNYSTGVLTGAGTSFGADGEAQVGDVIRIGEFPYIGDAVIVGITSARVLSIGSTSGLSGAAISGEEFSVTQSPKYVVSDSHYGSQDGKTSFVSGVAPGGSESASGTVFETGVGWVGVTTYMDNSNTPPVMRVKKEILVAMSGIQTGNSPVYDNNPLV